MAKKMGASEGTELGLSNIEELEAVGRCVCVCVCVYVEFIVLLLRCFYVFLCVIT